MTTYTVQRGDTLSAIARRFGLSVAELAARNGIADPNRIAVGQRLTIPGADAGAPLAVDASPGSSAWARPIVARALAAVLGRPATEREIQLTRATARLETGYGRGWPAGPMQGSHNWGAVQCCTVPTGGTCPPGSAPAKDTDPDKGGAAYMACFKVYADDDAGCLDMVRQMLGRSIAPTRRGPTVRDALASGDASLLAAAMWCTGYYEGSGKTARARIEDRARGLLANATQAAAAEGSTCAVVRSQLPGSAVLYRRRKGDPTHPAKGWDTELALAPGWFDLDNRSASDASGGGGAIALALVALLFALVPLVIR